ncbi:MAG: N-acetylmuramoyl-L-alanine amidase [Myxococcales bacterium]|nr:N-acetylmuramoyl-L-alanine amidase [Myxococcales bacterium]
MIRWHSVVGAALAMLASGCGPVGEIGSGPDEGALPLGETQAEGTSSELVFANAGLEFDVPASLLKSIAWVETRGQMIAGEVEHEGVEPAYGIMALRGEKLVEGAALADVEIEAAAADLASNVRAAAAWLSVRAAEQGIDRSDAAAWAEIVADYSGITEFEGRANYIHGEVYQTLRAGVATEALQLDALDVAPAFPLADAQLDPGPDYAGSLWRPSPNHSARPGGKAGDAQVVIIHTCEGTYSGCWSWLKNSGSGVSAHYVVNSTGKEVTQLVRENRKAWHISADYKCSLNSGKNCELNGYGGNNFTVGIEHAGYAKQSSWDEGLLHASAKLTCDVSKGQDIARDSYHIVGHGQLQPYNRIDPGPNWPWGKYLALVNSYCGGGKPPEPPPPQDPPPQPNPQPVPDPQPQPNPPPQPDPQPPLTLIVIDSNDANNGSNAKLVVSGSWTASNNVGGYYKTGYWWRTTGESSDLAEFLAYLPSAATLKVEAWWPAAADRSTAAPFVIYNANGTHLDTVYVNQQQNGGKWMALGTYKFTTGWNSVGLSRWTAPGSVVVADAVRFISP